MAHAVTIPSGLPPTPIQVGSAPEAVCGKTSWSVRPARTVPDQVTGSSVRRCAKRSSFSVKSVSYCDRS